MRSHVHVTHELGMFPSPCFHLLLPPNPASLDRALPCSPGGTETHSPPSAMLLP